MSAVADMADRIEAGERLSPRQALALLECPDLLAVGELAALAKRRRHGDRVFYNVNRHINYTNLCVNRCAFCAFRRDEGAADGYTLSLDEIADRAAAAAAAGATEVHVVGGLHPRLPLTYYEDLLRAIRAAGPRLHIKAFTAVELDHFARLSGLALIEVIERLRAAGLGSLPGGGAEIFAPRARQLVCPDKISGARWLEVMRTVHRAGLRTTATMLFGHVESAAERVEHLAELRRLQDETGGFQAFVALPFQDVATRLDGVRGPGGVAILKTLAVSRLFLDNIPHIKAYWVMMGVKLAQVALAFGVDDLDGTVVEEHIGHQAGADSPQALGREQLRRLIGTAGQRAVERDSLYRVVDRSTAGPFNPESMTLGEETQHE
jgi:aminodeoxyfutalosine synthase